MSKGLKVFLGCLPANSSAEDLEHYFSSYCQISKFKVKFRSNKVCAGYGHFIAHKKPRQPELLSEMFSTPHFHQGRSIECRPYLTGEALQRYQAKFNKRRVYVGSLPAGCSDQKLLCSFQSFGGVERAYIANNPDKNGEFFGFVIFFEEETARRALKARVCLEGQLLKVKEITRNGASEKAAEPGNAGNGAGEARGEARGGLRDVEEGVLGCKGFGRGDRRGSGLGTSGDVESSGRSRDGDSGVSGGRNEGFFQNGGFRGSNSKSDPLVGQKVFNHHLGDVSRPKQHKEGRRCSEGGLGCLKNSQKVGKNKRPFRRPEWGVWGPRPQKTHHHEFIDRREGETNLKMSPNFHQRAENESPQNDQIFTPRASNNVTRGPEGRNSISSINKTIQSSQNRRREQPAGHHLDRLSWQQYASRKEVGSFGGHSEPFESSAEGQNRQNRHFHSLSFFESHEPVLAQRTSHGPLNCGSGTSLLPEDSFNWLDHRYQPGSSQKLKNAKNEEIGQNQGFIGNTQHTQSAFWSSGALRTPQTGSNHQQNSQNSQTAYIHQNEVPGFPWRPTHTQSPQISAYQAQEPHNPNHHPLDSKNTAQNSNFGQRGFTDFRWKVQQQGRHYKVQSPPLHQSSKNFDRRSTAGEQHGVIRRPPVFEDFDFQANFEAQRAHPERIHTQQDTAGRLNSNQSLQNHQNGANHQNSQIGGWRLQNRQAGPQGGPRGPRQPLEHALRLNQAAGLLGTPLDFKTPGNCSGLSLAIELAYAVRKNHSSHNLRLNIDLAFGGKL